MTPTLEILVPVCKPDAGLEQTVASLAKQTDRNFEVLLSDNFSRIEDGRVNDAAKQLIAAGIAVRQAKAPFELKRLELWNWLHSQAQADWVKPLLPGEILKPEYVAQLKQRIVEKPLAQAIRCDAELMTEWGVEILRAPFQGASITAAQFGEYFPAQVDWICRSAMMAYNRTAWLATGGYSNQLPGFASLNLNVTLALHHGLENIAEPLVKAESPNRLPLNESGAERVNLPLELWLILRQARNYCLASKVPWRCGWPWGRAAAAWMGRW
jgi:hypothetical protein